MVVLLCLIFWKSSYLNIVECKVILSAMNGASVLSSYLNIVECKGIFRLRRQFNFIVVI